MDHFLVCERLGGKNPPFGGVPPIVVASKQGWPLMIEGLKLYMGNEKRAPGWLGYIGDEILPRYIGIILNHYKDPSLLTNHFLMDVW